MIYKFILSIKYKIKCSIFNLLSFPSHLPYQPQISVLSFVAPPPPSLITNVLITTQFKETTYMKLSNVPQPSTVITTTQTKQHSVPLQ